MNCFEKPSNTGLRTYLFIVVCPHDNYIDTSVFVNYLLGKKCRERCKIYNFEIFYEFLKLSLLYFFTNFLQKGSFLIDH